MDVPSELARLIRRAGEDPDVIAVLRFGSSIGGGSGRDVDVAVVLHPDRARAASEKSLEYQEFSSGTAHAGLDVAVFQALPLYVRHRVLADHAIMWSRDDDALYQVAIETVRDWEEYKPHYRAYLDAVAHG